MAADAPGYGAEFFDDAKDLANAEILNVQEPEMLVDIDFALAMASAISGVVRDAADLILRRRHACRQRFWSERGRQDRRYCRNR